MADSAEEFEPLFDYSRVQPPSVVCLDDEDSDADKSPAPFTKRAKIANLAATSSVNGNPKEKQVEIEDNEEDWLPPPPKVLVDGNNRRGEDSTLKELRLKKQELASVALSAKNLLREVEESAKVDVGNTSKDSLEPDLDVQTPVVSKERAKIVISVRDSDKEELKQYRLFVDDNFERLFKIYADKLKIDPESLVFVFDGDKIGPNDTPGGLGMEDDDMIEVNIKSS
ncbi:hypothetical protein IC582_022873 [Cucumis melo]|uniref:Uncharacterized protein LOC103489317 isoform X1 n=2 Tax=Cucumis melo TaxID=3656 RepID=A0A1S3BF31_CUCME|nr:uncharacterized protein LOC103489317 isoform X1 [Cucumis melo]KAA0034593.1 putative Ubiquitin-like superfamily protein [Cucumis melo var. makuwa]TYK09144.1 putative Ubiquitin-like superfamily protein [Cucumis melo var. makuwa]